MKSFFFALLAASSVSVSCAQTKPAPVTSVALSPKQTFPPVKLRGYGAVSGGLQISKAGGSVLTVDTENPQKAQLLQAKFISDYGLQYGVKKSETAVGANKVEIQEAQGQGSVAALRSGKTVYLVAATNSAQLTALVKTLPAAALSTSKAVVQVPMWLDRWDKFSFRHYYRAWEKPEGTTDANYDYTKEFDYAKEQDRAGLVFWNDALGNDSAEDMMNYGWWDWAQKEAKKRNLPVGLNANTPESAWIINRYEQETQLKMPDFTGNNRDLMSPFIGGQGMMSWNSVAGKDAQLGILQDSIRRFIKDPNITTLLEPHGELNHGPQDIFLEYGPVADAGYRRYLQSKYGTPAKVSERWKKDLKSWDDIHVPEVATFTGWGKQAFDLGGIWRVGYEELTGPPPSAYFYDRFGAPKTKPAPDEWYKPDFDDSKWPELKAPGNDKQFFLLKTPAVFRRKFDMPTDWKNKNQRTWLYLWDMNGASDTFVRVFVNGKEVGRSKIAYYAPHWGAIEVTDALKDGQNALALYLPQGHLAYKTYLSPTAPVQYPNLGEGLNAQWVDFAGYTQWSRVEGARRGTEMIRQVAPNQNIVFMAPMPYADGVKELASEYGGEFHDTGSMGAFWNDYPSSVMRGADLPFSLEPGNAATSLEEWKRQMAYYQTEGIQGIDYFIHIGSIMWNAEIKANYESIRKQLSLLGQSHYAKAQIGVLYSDRTAQLTGYPWGAAPNTNLAGSYWDWNTASVLRGSFAYDGLTQSSFARGEAKPYRVIVDTNTSIMDEAMVTDIEKWVRDGGTFITIAQTGRHTPEKPNSWPISRLTGYKVTKIDQLKNNGDIDETGTLKAAPDQKIYDEKWNGVRANGLHMEKVAADTQNLMLWDDGSVAAGLRPLGKGYIVQLGAKFQGAKIFDRVGPGENYAETKQLRQMLTALLNWREVAPEHGRLTAENENVWLRPAVTNNGLYDTWTVASWSNNTPQTVTVELGRGKNPAFAFEARDGKSYPITASPDGARLENIVLAPLETRVFLTPRNQIGNAPTAWFDLQRKWWRGTKAPAAKTLPAPTPRFARNLTPDWKFQALDKAADVKPYIVANYDDKSWDTQPLTVWDTKDSGGKGHGLFRKNFTVPAEWNNGKVSLYITSWWNTTFVERGRVWLDGNEIKGLNADPYLGIGLTNLKAGTNHSLVVEVQSDGVLSGLRGQTWISYEPTPDQKVDLAGQWEPSKDGLHYAAPIALPGNFDAQFLRRKFFVDAKYRGQNAVFTIEGERSLVCVLINGKMLRRHHHGIGGRGSLNLTPFIKWGAENEIEVIRWDGAAQGEVKEAFVGFYDPKFYP